MFRLFFLSSTVFSVATAWIVSSKVSSFGGSVLLTAREQPLYHGHGTGVCSTLEMKGKGGVPPHMRGQMQKQKEMAAYQKQMVESQKQGADGFPIFNLFVRTSKANVSKNNRNCKQFQLLYLVLTVASKFGTWYYFRFSLHLSYLLWTV